MTGVIVKRKWDIGKIINKISRNAPSHYKRPRRKDSLLEMWILTLHNKWLGLPNWKGNMDKMTVPLSVFLRQGASSNLQINVVGGKHIMSKSVDL